MSAKLKSDIEAYVINRVKERREALNIAQSELAVELNVSDGFIGQVESSKSASKYNLNHLNKLAIILRCSIKDFMPDEPLK
jgi:transcriptional regulator with XRE-family HTH domain